MATVTNLKVVKSDGSQAREFALPTNITSFAVKPVVVHQAVVAYAANRRKPTAHTKNRAEVSGGGKKPWKQKGTGRARQGSIRAPQWKGGGVVFGPRNERVYTHRLPARVASLARAMVVADYLQNGKVLVVEAFPTDQKTKSAAQLLQAAGATRGRSLLLLTAAERASARGFANLPHVEVMGLREINVLDGLKAARWVVSAAGLEELMKFVRS